MNRIVLSVVTALLLAGAVGGFVAWRRATEPARAWSELLELEGVDLRSLAPRERERACRLIRRFLDSEIAKRGWDSLYWRLVRLAPSTPEERVLLLWTEKVEGVALGLVSVEFGRRGAMIQIVAMDAVAETAASRFHDPVGVWCLDLVTAAKAGDRIRHIFVAYGEGWTLLRTETPEGRAVARPSVPVGPPGIGPWWAKTPPPDWAQALRGSDGIEILVRLSWLGMRPGPSEVEAARADPDVRAAVGALRTSPNPWIREAAELALRP